MSPRLATILHHSRCTESGIVHLCRSMHRSATRSRQLARTRRPTQMTLLRVCRCGRLIPATRRRCAACERAESTRRRNKPSGQGLRRSTLAQDPPGRPQARRPHLPGLRRARHPRRPSTPGHHPPSPRRKPIRPNHCRACCASCAGRADAARAHTLGGRGSVEKPIRPQIPDQLAARKTSGSLQQSLNDSPPFIA